MAMAIPAPGSSCLSGALHKITKEKPDLEYLYFDAAELERIWRMDANGDYNIWSELEDNA